MRFKVLWTGCLWNRSCPPCLSPDDRTAQPSSDGLCPKASSPVHGTGPRRFTEPQLRGMGRHATLRESCRRQATGQAENTMFIRTARFAEDCKSLEKEGRETDARWLGKPPTCAETVAIIVLRKWACLMTTKTRGLVWTTGKFWQPATPSALARAGLPARRRSTRFLAIATQFTRDLGRQPRKKRLARASPPPSRVFYRLITYGERLCASALAA